MIAEIIAKFVYIWTCQLRLFMRSTADSKPLAADGSESSVPPVAEIEADAAHARPVHGVELALRPVLSSMTATPRASAPRAFMP